LELSRRTFLIGAGGGALVLSGVAGQRALDWAERRSTVEWAGLVTGLRGVYDLGVEYLFRFPEEQEFDVLVSHLSGVFPPFAPLTVWRASTEPLRLGIQRDFEEGRVANLGGWVLSRTELRLCAIGPAQTGAATGMKGVFGEQRGPDDEPFHWTVPRAGFLVPAGAERLEFRLRSGAPAPQQVTVRINGRTADEVTVSGSEWHPVRYIMPRGENVNLRLELDTTPPWKPLDDFRTFGVGIDRVWTPA
jgi:hypothetical protein